mmetsp:Transcript_31070/g.39937  ORF Transcript_31070/g.39937 Transcript_31070/m.39937 type:complete len:458 (+) Transcript_31070:93-1466(+)
MIKSAIFVALLSTDMRSGHAFQVSSPIRLAPSRVLIPHTQSTSKIVFQNSPWPTTLHQRMLRGDSNENDLDVEPLPVEVVESSTNDRSDDTNALAKFWDSTLKQIRNTRPEAFFLSLAIFLLPFFLLSGFPQSASAVMSGGRMGGSFGGSSRQSSSRTYSAPSSGYSRGYSRGYSSGYYSRPNVTVSPGVSPYYSPFYSPFSPFYARPSGVVVTTGPSFGGLFFFAGFFLFAAAVLSNIGSSVGDSVGSTFGSNQSVLGPGVSVAEISVALEVPNRDSPNSILSALDRLSRTARTDSRVGLQNLTSQVAIELLRRKSSIVGCSTHANHYRDENKAQREYNNVSIQERGKFQRETVSKYGGVDYSDARIQTKPSDNSAKATVAVVTIVMMIDGDSTSKQLSGRVNSIRDVEDALSRIAADSKADSCLRGAEILWTPEERDETLTMREVFADYPGLRSV